MGRKRRDAVRKRAEGLLEQDAGAVGVGEKGKAGSQIVILFAVIVIVALAVTATHWPALSAKAFSYDDSQYLIENQLVQNPSWTSAGRFLTEVLEPSTVKGYYQPLAMISLMLDYAMGGRDDNLGPFHRTSLCLHVVNTTLVIVLLYLLFGQPWVAGIVGLLFGLHPMTVEPVTWVSDRKTLLAAFFALGTLICYVEADQHTDSDSAAADGLLASKAPEATGFFGEDSLFCRGRDFCGHNIHFAKPHLWRNTAGCTQSVAYPDDPLS